MNKTFNLLLFCLFFTFQAWSGTCPPTGGGGTCQPYNSIIYGGQTYNTGSTVVTNSLTDLSIQLTSNSTAGWYIKAYHIYVGTGPIPTNNAGVPAPGQFPYQQSYTAPQSSVNFTASLASLNVVCGTSLNIAVHTEMVKLDSSGNVIQSETGWTYGPNVFDANRWGWWFSYKICCSTIPTNLGCTLTQGYWKTHNKYATQPSLKLNWPLSESTLLCGQTWLDIIKTNPSGGDAWLILAHQYIAAKLNVASGASSGTVIDQIISNSSALLSNNCSTVPESLRQQALEYGLLLDSYNNGITGPGHCN